MISIIIFSIVSIFFSIPFCSRPITLGIWVFIASFILSCLLTTLSINWFGMILFLIYIGGILVIFSYFVAIEPNQHLEVIKIFTILILTTTIIIILLPHPTSNNGFIKFIEQEAPLRIILSHNNTFILLFLVILLFLTLIVIVKISFRNKSPLRPFKYALPYTKNTSNSKNP